MSWSFSGVGTPNALKRALAAAGEGLTGASKDEFDHAAPHLVALLDAADETAAVSLNANGHAGSDGKRRYASIGVEIKQLGKLYE